MNALTLAYLGDSIYEINIRSFLIKKGIVKVNELQKEAVKYVSAKGQAQYLMKMIKENMFTEEELTIIKRARNHKVLSHPKNTAIVTYKLATGLEALIGHLYLEKNNERIQEIMSYITKQKQMEE
ncbi:MAG: ribonuclease III domain-containing protein [Bacilli bacterium]